jgi:hypothetical protein
MPLKQKLFYGRPNFLQAARVEEHQYGVGFKRGSLNNVKGKRLVIPSRGNNGDFKVLLFPFATTNPIKGDKDAINQAWQKDPQGAPVPVTEWNQDRTRLTVTLEGQTDTFTFKKGADGRTRVVLERDGRSILSGE